MASNLTANKIAGEFKTMREQKPVDNLEIARRLRLERKIAGKTQEMAAKAIGVSRATLAAFENGLREIQLKEIMSLTKFYGISVNQFLRQGVVYTDIVPRFRKLQNTKNAQVLEAIQLLNKLISAEVELENILGIENTQNYPNTVKIGLGNVNELAERHANELREFLNLGGGPIPDIFSVISDKLGIRLYQCPLSKKLKVSGLYAFDRNVGACILLNANHPRTRRVMSAAHELAHFYCNREQVEVLDSFERKSLEERYANLFSKAFVMPQKNFSKSFHDMKVDKRLDQKQLFVELASIFGVSIQDCVLRLEDVQLIERDTWKNMISNSSNLQELEDSNQKSRNSSQEIAYEKIDRLVPYRLSVLAHLAWKRELMSEGVLSSLLRIGRVELREILSEIEQEGPIIDDKIGRKIGKIFFGKSEIGSTLDLLRNPASLLSHY